MLFDNTSTVSFSWPLWLNISVSTYSMMTYLQSLRNYCNQSNALAFIKLLVDILTVNGSSFS